MEVAVIGAGIGGLTLALELHASGISCQVFESSPSIEAVGVGINILPHATRELALLGLEDALARSAVTTRETVFYNRFGQLIYKEPLGRFGGYEYPQFSIHRGDLQSILLQAVEDRVGPVLCGWKCTGLEQNNDEVAVAFEDGSTGLQLKSQHARVAVACDGINSAVRRQFYPKEGPPRYSGINMWRGITRWSPILTGASMIRVGWLTTGKMVIYPIRNTMENEGQLINWVAEIETAKFRKRDWTRAGRLDDFAAAFDDWHFDWLDVPEFLRASEVVLEFPMVDQEPLDSWSIGRVTLLGDAAHPMVPRGSNGAGQAILDACVLADCLVEIDNPVAALRSYERRRLPATTQVVLTNRKDPPDAILREVYKRTGDRPFESREDVISQTELELISERYKQISGNLRSGQSDPSNS
jgi:2-polyprenyl-6-methoxyphenol hydroxylase-like FAD-dependent oxidoreductase